MKKALILAAALSVTASVASAGGMAIVPDEGNVEVVEVQKSSSGAWVPLLLGVVIIAAVAGGNGS